MIKRKILEISDRDKDNRCEKKNREKKLMDWYSLDRDLEKAEPSKKKTEILRMEGKNTKTNEEKKYENRYW